MSLPFAYLVNVALLARLPMQLQDDPVSGRRALAGTVVQILALVALTPTWAVMVAALAVAAVNVVAWWWERRRSASGLMAVRLLVLAVITFVFATLCSPFLDLR